MLVTAVEASSVGSICGLIEGQTTVDWSSRTWARGVGGGSAANASHTGAEVARL
jgi:hypothetical protein